MVDPKHLPFDDRLKGICVYCGRPPETRDHVPPRVLLDNPLPSGYTVPACTTCNGSVSSDEEYLACFVECVISGSTDTKKISRPKVIAALNHSAGLCAEISSSQRERDWMPDFDRIRNVAMKLAKGHAAYELGECPFEPPSVVEAIPLILLSTEALQEFEVAGAGMASLWPEVGSRAFHRVLGAHPYEHEPGPWISVQAGRYRYSVGYEQNVVVRVVVSEYLAITVRW